jgi:hypothetical protein
MTMQDGRDRARVGPQLHQTTTLHGESATALNSITFHSVWSNSCRRSLSLVPSILFFQEIKGKERFREKDENEVLGV